MNSYKTDVAIAGAGLAGRTLAHLLCRRGVRCILIDTGNKPSSSTARTSDPRALAITPASSAILASIGIWPRLPGEQIGRFERMQVWDETSGGEITFDSAELCEPVLGYIVEQSALQSLLEQSCAFLPDCAVITGTRVAELAIQPDSIAIQLDNGDRIAAQLLVATDGGSSPVRQLAGLQYTRHDYRQQAIVTTVTTALAHDNTARQRFLRGGPLAFLPLADPHRSGIVWSTGPDHARELLALPETAFQSTLQQAFEHRLGEITACGPRSGFELFDAYAPAYVSDRIVLAGDAAHTVHPLAGQGANLGLLDVAVLAELILDARQAHRNPWSYRVLRQYERWRKADNQRMRITLNLLKRLFEADNGALIGLRGLGMSAFDSIPAIKSAIMRKASGLEGDLPASAKHPLYPEMI